MGVQRVVNLEGTDHEYPNFYEEEARETERECGTGFHSCLRGLDEEGDRIGDLFTLPPTTFV